MPRFPQEGEHFPGELRRDPLPLCGLAEEAQRVEDFLVDVARLEDRDHVAGEGLDLVSPPLLGVEDGELQGHEGGVVAHAAGRELSANFSERRDPLLPVAEAGRDAPFDPPQTEEIHLAAALSRQVDHPGQERFRLREALEPAEVVGQAVLDAEDHPPIVAGNGGGARREEDLHGLFKVSPLFREPGAAEEDLDPELHTGRRGGGLLEESRFVPEAVLAPPERGFEGEEEAFFEEAVARLLPGLPAPVGGKEGSFRSREIPLGPQGVRDVRQGQAAHFGAPGGLAGDPVRELERQLGERCRLCGILGAAALAFEAEDLAQRPGRNGGRTLQLAELP